jgi:hypothetical protein
MQLPESAKRTFSGFALELGLSQSWLPIKTKSRIIKIAKNISSISVKNYYYLV